MKPAPFDFVAATSIGEAVSLLGGSEGARVIAGGQSLMPLLAMRAVRPKLLVDINGLGLDDVSMATDGREIRLGALVRQRRLERDPAVASVCPLLAEAAGLVGHPAIRNRGTLGGSLANADPRAELATALLALGGSMQVEGPGGRRTLHAADLSAVPLTSALRSDELLVEVSVPRAAAGDGSAFCEWTPRTRDFAVAGVAVVVHTTDGVVSAVRGAACGVAPAALDLGEALSALAGSGPPSDSLLRAIAAAVRS
ncbi:MAG: FAD binding domain-containing protein, partial [Actinomycetota bacterium]|nr:FAD binding domain-containing protein [Actinomycetota bacterium]